MCENSQWMKGLVSELSEKLQHVRRPPSTSYFTRATHSARDRILKVLDPGTEFLEFSPLAAWDRYENEVPSASLITGLGTLRGRECIFISNDSSIKGGTYFPESVRKHIRAQEIALANRLPCIYFVDSGGANLPLQSELFPDAHHFGRSFYLQSLMSARKIPQIGLVFGNCTAGGAYIPALCDENIIVKNQGFVFLGGPPLVRAATGEKVSAEELGGALLHTEKSGVIDHLAQDEDHAFEILRSLADHLPSQELVVQTFNEPMANPEDIYKIVPKDPKTHFDIREIISFLADESDFHEFKKNFAPTLVTGFARIGGHEVGIIGNNGVLFSNSALKATHFIELCDQRRTPLLFLQNITGFMVGAKYESEGIARHGAKMVKAVSLARVPRITIVVGGSYGAGNYAMCGRGLKPRFLWMWPNARISVMGGEQAAKVLSTVKRDALEERGQTLSEAESQALEQPVVKKYEKESSAYYSTSRIWDDGILDPKETRKILIRILPLVKRRIPRRRGPKVYRT